MIEIDESMAGLQLFTVTKYFIKNCLYCCYIKCRSVLAICQYKKSSAYSKKNYGFKLFSLLVCINYMSLTSRICTLLPVTKQLYGLDIHEGL